MENENLPEEEILAREMQELEIARHNLVLAEQRVINAVRNAERRQRRENDNQNNIDNQINAPADLTGGKSRRNKYKGKSRRNKSRRR